MSNLIKFFAGFILFIFAIGSLPVSASTLDGTLDPGFIHDSMTDMSINAILVQPDGKILIGGDFTQYLGVSVNRLVRLNTDGTLDNTFDIDQGFECTNLLDMTSYSTTGGMHPLGATSGECGVYSLALQPDGKILVGGYFDIVNGQLNHHRNITRLNSNGSFDASFNPGGEGIGYIDEGGDLRENGAVFDVEYLPSGKILLGGPMALNYYNGNPVDMALIRLNSDGTCDNTFNVGGSDTWIMGQGEGGVWGSVYEILQLGNGQFLAAGYIESFKDADRHYVNGIARFNADGTLDTSFLSTGDDVEYEYNNTDLGADGTIYDMELQSDGKIVIVGDFTYYSQVLRHGLARLNSDGSLDTTFNTSAGELVCPTGSAYYDTCTLLDALLLPNGKIMVGGKFISFDGNPAINLMRLNNNGTYDDLFVGNAGGDNLVDLIFTMALQSDGRLLAGGYFANYNSVDVTNIVRIGVEDIIEPSITPTPAPTVSPSVTPSPTASPTPNPTVAPTVVPTVAPSPTVTILPTNNPTPTTTVTSPVLPTMAIADPTSLPVETIIPTATIYPSVTATAKINKITENPTALPENLNENQQFDWSWLLCLCLLLLAVFLFVLFLLYKKKKDEEEEKKKKAESVKMRTVLG